MLKLVKIVIEESCCCRWYVNIGDKTQIFSFTSIGSDPQDLKFKGEKTEIIIGEGCKIREYCTINPGQRVEEVSQKLE